MSEELERMFPDYRIACDGKAGAVLKRIVVVPDGEVKSRKGNFNVDKEAWGLVSAAFDEHGIDIVVDYEHQTLGGEYSSPSGKAPAAGWIKALTYEPGKGIVADVEWLDEAQALLSSKSYRYLSPVTEIRKSDRRMVRLHSVALTNTPAILQMEAIAAKASASIEENEMTKDTKVQANQDPAAPAEGGPDEMMVLVGLICGKLGISPEGSVLDILKSINEKVGSEGDGEDTSEEASKIRTALQVAKDAGTDVVVAKIGELRGHVGYVPAEEYKKVTNRLDALEQANKAREAEELVDGYVQAGKLNPDDANRMKWANDMAVSQPAAFKTLMDGAPDIRPPQGSSTPPKGGKAGGRAQIIAAAKTEYETDTAASQMTTFKNWINGALRENGEKPLTDTELETVTA